MINKAVNTKKVMFGFMYESTNNRTSMDTTSERNHTLAAASIGLESADLMNCGLSNCFA